MFYSLSLKLFNKMLLNEFSLVFFFFFLNCHHSSFSLTQQQLNTFKHVDIVKTTC